MKRGLSTAMLLSASLAISGCNSPKPAMVNKTPAVEGIMVMDSGVKEVKKPESKLTVVPAKVSEEPLKPVVSPVPANPYKKKAEPKKSGYDLSGFKPRDPPKSNYDPTKDTDLWYPVDENGIRTDKKKTNPTD